VGQGTYIYPGKTQAVEHLLHPSRYPVVVFLNSLPSLLVQSVLSIEDEDWIYRQSEQVAAAPKQCRQIRALGIAMTIACGENPASVQRQSAVITIVRRHLRGVNPYSVPTDPSHVVDEPLLDSEVA
jgi:hypothetical protein